MDIVDILPNCHSTALRWCAIGLHVCEGVYALYLCLRHKKIGPTAHVVAWCALQLSSPSLLTLRLSNRFLQTCLLGFPSLRLLRQLGERRERKNSDCLNGDASAHPYVSSIHS